MNHNLSKAELLRYSRNIILTEVGLSGQERLKLSSVLLVGVGGISSSSALYLAAAGVGRIGLVDGSTVELSNLQRQIIFRTNDVHGAKVERAGEAISALNPHCAVDTHRTRLKDARITRELMRGYDVVIDGSDNSCTRFLVADCCWLEGAPLVSVSGAGFRGQLLVVIPGAENSCYRCLIPETPPGERRAVCRQTGMFGGVAGVIGSLAAVETVKVLLGNDPSIANRFLTYDAISCRFLEGERVRDPECPLCGGSQTVPRKVAVHKLFQGWWRTTRFSVS